MRKVLLIFICLQIISSNSFAEELMKVPFLVQHYFQHQKTEGSDWSFGEYLKDHYLSDHHSDKDNSEDEKLPFKHSHDGCTHAPIIVAVVPDNSVSIDCLLVDTDSEILPDSQLHSNFHNCIWQPPKIG